jgi:hypothetical protein
MAVIVGAALVIAGLAPVVYLLALIAWQFSALFEAGSWVSLPATLLFTDHSVLQGGKAAPVLPFIPQFPWPWLMSPESLLPLHTVVASLIGRVHVGLAFALAGVAVMALGAQRTRQYVRVIRAEKQRREDRLRRVHDYCLDEGRARGLEDRREPYIGPDNVRRVA